MCHTFLHVARAKTHTAKRECTRFVQKRATKSDTSGHCLVCSGPAVLPVVSGTCLGPRTAYSRSLTACCVVLTVYFASPGTRSKIKEMSCPEPRSVAIVTAKTSTRPFLRVAQHLPQPHDCLEHFCPTFRTNCPDGSLFCQMGSHYAQNTTTNPSSLLSRHKPLLGYVCTQDTPNPTPKHHFSWPELESGQNQLSSEQNRPQLGKMFEKWAKRFWK